MAKVLIVDDSAVLAKIAASNLTKAGHQVIFAENGEDALGVVARDRPDVIFLDAEMPVMDGWETCDALKSNADTKSIPVLMCTGDGSQDNVEKARQMGAVGYIIKPYKAEEMLAKLNQALSH